MDRITKEQIGYTIDHATGESKSMQNSDEVGTQDNDGDVEMEAYESADEALEASEATMAGYPAPPPPPPPAPSHFSTGQRAQHEQSDTPAESDSEPLVGAPP